MLEWEKNDIMSNVYRRHVVCMESRIKKRNGRMGTYKYDSAVFRRNGILTLSVGPDQWAEKASNVEKSNSLFPSVPQTMFPKAHII